MEDNKLEIVKNKLIAIYGDRYDFDSINTFKVHNKVKIICKKHGEFFQRLDHLLSGHSCRKCSAENASLLKRFTFSDFLKKHKKNIIINMTIH